MTKNSRVQEIKHAQREASLYRNLATFIQQIVLDDRELEGLYVHRVKLSPDRRSCTVFVHLDGGIEKFEKIRPTLVLYKSSLRNALSKSMSGHHVPDLRFVYDAKLDEKRSVDDLIDRLKADGKL